VSILTELISLFIVAFLAATILPAQSEILLGAYYIAGKSDPYLLLLFATTGNVLGSCVNWIIGRSLNRLKNYKWFPVKEETLSKATNIYNKYGIWSLLLAWVPFIGDPLTIVAGVLRAHFRWFVVLVTIGKLLRYIVVLYALGFRF
tara:strand:- start:1678 stop:2115 length:438 start_codon:yes stop_codon:yes gene_type:complete